MFPEIRRAWKQFTADKGELLSLNLKTSAFVDHSLQYLEDHGYSRYGNPAGGAWSGESVTRDTALSHSVVWACYRLVSSTIGRMPANLMINETRGKRNAIEHPMFRAMHDEPNPEMSARGFKEMLTGHCMIDRDAFAKIHRRSGRNRAALELEPLLPHQVKVDREKQGQKRLVYKLLNERGVVDGTYTLERGKPHEIFHLRGISWDGIRGHSMLDVGRQPIGTALAAERNVGMFWKRGGRSPSHLDVTENPFPSDDELKAYSKDFHEAWRDPHRVVLVEKGLKLEKDGSTMVEAQALESRQWTVSDLARLWGVSPHLVGDLSRATFSNIEQLFLEFKTITISDWANRWEQDWNRCVLTPQEKEENHFLKFNLNAFLIGDFKTRMEGYSSGLQNGHLCIDDVLEFEDRNKLPDGAGQARHIQMNMQTLPGTGAPTVTEQAILARIEKDKAAAAAQSQKPKT